MIHTKIPSLLHKSIALFVFAIYIATSISAVRAESSVWQVTSDNSTLFIGGTVHLLRPTDYPLPSEYEAAYLESEELYFETDISSMNDLSVQAKMLQELTYND